MKDPELDELLKPLRSLRPSESEIHSWAWSATNTRKSPSRARYFFQLATAVFVGLVLGAALMKAVNPVKFVPASQNFLADATFEHSHDNLD